MTILIERFDINLSSSLPIDTIGLVFRLEIIIITIAERMHIAKPIAEIGRPKNIMAFLFLVDIHQIKAKILLKLSNKLNYEKVA